jgi:hypothetical protein
MRASALSRYSRWVFVVALASLCGACSSLDTLYPNRAYDSRTQDGVDSHSAATTAADRIVKLPMTAADLDCPEVEVEDGAASVRVGGPENSQVQHQFDLVDTARECEPAGSQFTLKVGVSGRLLIGPAGSPGAYSTDLKVLVRRESDQKTAYEKTLRVEANTAGGVQAPFQVVTEPFSLPMNGTRLNDQYSIFVGFENGHNVSMERPRRHRKPRAAAAAAATQ